MSDGADSSHVRRRPRRLSRSSSSASMVSAPYCAKLLRRLWSRRGEGRVARRRATSRAAWGPFPRRRAPDLEKSGVFHFLNTNKRSVTIDVDDADDRSRSVPSSWSRDALTFSIENQPPATHGRAGGLDFESPLPASIRSWFMISITALWPDGSLRGAGRGYDLNAYHLSGRQQPVLWHVPNEMPLEHGTFAADFFGAVTGAAWGLAAVHRPRQTSAVRPARGCFLRGGHCGHIRGRPEHRRLRAGRPLRQANERGDAARGARRASCPARTATSGCWPSSPRQWNGLASGHGQSGLDAARDVPGHVRPGRERRSDLLDGRTSGRCRTRQDGDHGRSVRRRAARSRPYSTVRGSGRRIPTSRKGATFGRARRTNDLGTDSRRSAPPSS